jgi:hypothetical protein
VAPGPSVIAPTRAREKNDDWLAGVRGGPRGRAWYGMLMLKMTSSAWSDVTALSQGVENRVQVL